LTGTGITDGGARHGAGIPAPLSRRRLALTLLLLLGWIALVPLLWSAFSTLPSAERLEQSRMARIPTLGAFLFMIGKSAAELLAVLALTWPRVRGYATRLAAAAFVLVAWFFISTPLSLTRMEWLHRRWLVAMVLLLLVALVLELALRRVRPRRT
jgi:hypothetical protein